MCGLGEDEKSFFFCVLKQGRRRKKAYASLSHESQSRSFRKQRLLSSYPAPYTARATATTTYTRIILTRPLQSHIKEKNRQGKRAQEPISQRSRPLNTFATLRARFQDPPSTKKKKVARTPESSKEGKRKMNKKPTAGQVQRGFLKNETTTYRRRHSSRRPCLQCAPETRTNFSFTEHLHGAHKQHTRALSLPPPAAHDVCAHAQINNGEHPQLLAGLEHARGLFSDTHTHMCQKSLALLEAVCAGMRCCCCLN